MNFAYVRLIWNPGDEMILTLLLFLHVLYWTNVLLVFINFSEGRIRVWKQTFLKQWNKMRLKSL